jgi:hypothetical protein
MSQPLTARERKIGRAFSRCQKLRAKAELAYSRANRAEDELAQEIFKLRRHARVLDQFTRAVRISEGREHLIVKAQMLAAQFEALEALAGRGEGDGKVWAHGSVRPWKLSTKNLD